MRILLLILVLSACSYACDFSGSVSGNVAYEILPGVYASVPGAVVTIKGIDKAYRARSNQFGHYSITGMDACSDEYAIWAAAKGLTFEKATHFLLPGTDYRAVYDIEIDFIAQ
jgi:hypothetical protein